MSNRGCTITEYERWRTLLTSNNTKEISRDDKQHPIVECAIQLISVGVKNTPPMNHRKFVAFLMRLYVDTRSALYEKIVSDNNFDPFPLNTIVSFFSCVWDEVEYKFEAKVRDNVALKPHLTVSMAEMINWWYANSMPIRMLNDSHDADLYKHNTDHVRKEALDLCNTYDITVKMFQACTSIEGDMLKSAKILNVANSFNKLIDKFESTALLANDFDETLPAEFYRFQANCGYYGGIAYRIHGGHYPTLSLFCFRKTCELFMRVYKDSPLVVLLFLEQYWQTVRLNYEYVENINCIRMLMEGIKQDLSDHVKEWRGELITHMTSLRMLYLPFKHKNIGEELARRSKQIKNLD